MALPPLNLSGLATPTGATVSRKEVSSGIRRLLAESQRAAQTRDLLVEEIASGALPAGAAQQVARNAHALGRTGRAFAQDAVTRANYEAATAGRGKKIAGALLSAGGTVLAQALSMRGEDGEATTAGMDKAFEEEISPGDLTVPGGPAARLQAEAARQAERSQFGVPALTVDPSVLAAQDLRAPQSNPRLLLQPLASATDTAFGLNPQVVGRTLPVNPPDVDGKLPAGAGDFYAPSFAPEAAGRSIMDLRMERAAQEPQVDQFPDISSRSKEDKALMGIKEEPDVAKLISDAMALKDKEEQRKALRKIMRQYGDGRGGEGCYLQIR